MVFKIENLKLFERHNVEITSKVFLSFLTLHNLQYFMQTESDSSFGG